MKKENTYPGLYIARDSETRIVPGLCAEGYHVIMLCGQTPENETLLGRRYYDYSDAALTCCTSDRAAIYTQTCLRCRWIAAFRPEFFDEARSEKTISDYTFFNYRPNESLHLSVAETGVMNSCITDIRIELQRPRDHYSGAILARHIHRILDYATRYYERQFITRDLVVERIIGAYDRLLERYLQTGSVRTLGEPAAKSCAENLQLSEACFRDMLKHKTGLTHESYFQTKRIETAKRKLTGSNVPLQQLVADLGFPSVQYFSYIFKKLTGCTPCNYRFLS